MLVRLRRCFCYSSCKTKVEQPQINFDIRTQQSVIRQHDCRVFSLSVFVSCSHEFDSCPHVEYLPLLLCVLLANEQCMDDNYWFILKRRLHALLILLISVISSRTLQQNGHLLKTSQSPGGWTYFTTLCYGHTEPLPMIPTTEWHIIWSSARSCVGNIFFI